MAVNNIVELKTKDHGAEINVYQKNSIWNSFTSGLAWGVGSVLGATLIAGTIIFIVSKLNTVPYLGQYISEIINYVKATSK